MLVHENTLISLDVIEEEFVCNLAACKGACCIEGEFGAPLEEIELAIIERELPAILPFMAPKSADAIQKEGFYELDTDGDWVTKCIKGRDCVFAIHENGIYKCAIEKAYEHGKTEFIKPISCHLYPIRLAEVGTYTALNYSRWDICSAACKNGKKLKVPIYKFLKTPLTRRFGASWYDELSRIADEYLKTK
jgi:Fe-S-cluster containining protein